MSNLHFSRFGHHRLIVALFVLPLLIPTPSIAAKQVPATPHAGELSQDALLVDAIFTQPPTAPAFVGIARMIFTPGSMINGGRIAGPRILYVESGSVVVAVADDTATLKQVGNGDKRISTGEVLLESGDQLIFQSTPPIFVAASETSTSTLLDIVIWPSLPVSVTSKTTENGVIFQPLVVGDSEGLPAGPLRLQLATRTLPAGESTSYAAQQGPHLLLITSGKLALTTEGGSTEYAPAAGNNPGSLLGPSRPLRQDKPALLTAGGNSFLQQSAVVGLRNIGRNDLELLTLAISPALDSSTG